VRIGIVNDLPMVAELLRRLIYASGEHEIAWIARDGTEAVTRCAGDLPELVLMDLIMPHLDGVEATRQIMRRSPCPILILTASVGGNATKVFEALGAGALDAIDIPTVTVTRKTGRSLLRKIKVIERQIAGKETLAEDTRPKVNSATESLVVMGASAGGPAALANVLSTLPDDFPSAIVIIQHIDERFAQGLVDWLSKRSKLPVRLACEDDCLISGHVFVAGGGNHLVFTKPSRLGYTAEPAGNPYCPSVDVFFASVARYFRGSITGVLLTGMGQDGARGLKTLRDAGFHTIAQDEKSSAVYAMPKAAAAINAASEILPLLMIGPRLKEIFGAEALATNTNGRAVAHNSNAKGENK
jgi:two-component system response regulator WspF